jgi:hypothetical protein
MNKKADAPLKRISVYFLTTEQKLRISFALLTPGG